MSINEVGIEGEGINLLGDAIPTRGCHCLRRRLQVDCHSSTFELPTVQFVVIFKFILLWCDAGTKGHQHWHVQGLGVDRLTWVLLQGWCWNPVVMKECDWNLYCDSDEHCVGYCKVPAVTSRPWVSTSRPDRLPTKKSSQTLQCRFMFNSLLTLYVEIIPAKCKSFRAGNQPIRVSGLFDWWKTMLWSIKFVLRV